jgi:hypothetical protein
MEVIFIIETVIILEKGLVEKCLVKKIIIKKGLE